jgi:5'-methylthioadenosine phosphorylase
MPSSPGNAKGRVFDRGVYVNTDGRHLKAGEVGHVQNVRRGYRGAKPLSEVYLAREIGACYAGVYLVVNYAEGIVSPGSIEEMRRFSIREPGPGKMPC